MPIEKNMPLKEQMKFNLEAENVLPEDVEVLNGDPQLDEDGGG